MKCPLRSYLFLSGLLARMSAPDRRACLGGKKGRELRWQLSASYQGANHGEACTALLCSNSGK